MDKKYFEELKKENLGNGLFISQFPDSFRFGIDAVLLSDFASKRIKNNSTVYDLCTGNGIIPLLIHSRKPNVKIVGVEIQEDVSNLARYNVEQNGLEESITIINQDMMTLDNKLNSKVSYITINPPYMSINEGAGNDISSLNVARHEISAKLEDTIRLCNRLLKDKGSVFMVHRAQRIQEIAALMYQNKLKIKQLRFVCPNKKKNANLVLIEAMKYAGDFTTVLPDLVVYDDDGNYNDEIYEIYNMKDEKE